MLEPDRAVEIFASDGTYSTSTNRSYGSAYRIGGRLVLTAAHLFAEDRSCCEVRSKHHPNPSEKVAAQVVWKSFESDVALLELPETFKDCTAVTFGELPVSSTVPISFQIYGWPEFARATISGHNIPGGFQVEGQIYLDDTVHDSLLRLRVGDGSRPSIGTGGSPWAGCSGAAVICSGFVVAVQSEHTRTEHQFLAAAPLSKVHTDPTWELLLKQHGINPQLQTVRLSGTASQASSYLQPERIPSIEQEMAVALQRLNYDHQQDIFDDFLDSDRLAEAFTVVVSYDIEADLQKCLVSRLSRSLMGGNPPEFCPLGVDRSWRKNPTSELLQRLAPSLGLNATASMIEVHQSIAQLCQTQSVVIALYGVPNMGSKLSTLLDEFWNPLVAMLHESLEVSHRGRLLLFLAGDKPEEDWVRQSSLVCLEPPLAQIMTAEVHRWGRLPEVQQFKNRCQKEARLLDLDKLRSSSISRSQIGQERGSVRLNTLKISHDNLPLSIIYNTGLD